MAMINYKKGCVSSTMVAMALQHTKGAQALPDVPTVHVVASVAPPVKKINEDLLVLLVTRETNGLHFLNLYDSKTFVLHYYQMLEIFNY